MAFGTIAQLMLEALAAGETMARDTCRAEAGACVEFCRRVGLPVTLAALGITAAEQGAAIPQIAARAVVPGETIHNMPFPVTAAMVAAAVEAADAVGSAAT